MVEGAAHEYELARHAPRSKQLVRSFGISESCMRERAKQPASHDNLFHTLLGVFGVQTSEYDRSKDLLASCEEQK